MISMNSTCTQNPVHALLRSCRYHVKTISITTGRTCKNHAQQAVTRNIGRLAQALALCSCLKKLCGQLKRLKCQITLLQCLHCADRHSGQHHHCFGLLFDEQHWPPSHQAAAVSTQFLARIPIPCGMHPHAITCCRAEPEPARSTSSSKCSRYASSGRAALSFGVHLITMLLTVVVDLLGKGPIRQASSIKSLAQGPSSQTGACMQLQLLINLGPP